MNPATSPSAATPAPGLSVRAARAGDLPRIVAGANAVFRAQPSARGATDMGRDYPLLFSTDNLAHLVVVEHDGLLVGHAGFVLGAAIAGGQRFTVACFGAIFTLPAFRGRGGATAALDEAIRRAQAAGAGLGLISGNRALYRRAGFAPYPACPRFHVGAGPARTARATVTPFAWAALPALRALHAREDLRFERSEADWRQLLGTGVVFYDRARVFTVHSGGAIVAYLVVGEQDALDPTARGAAHRVLELAGDRAAIVDALPALLEALAARDLDVVVPGHDHALAARLAAAGAQATSESFGFGYAWWWPELGALPLPWYGLNYV